MKFLIKKVDDVSFIRVDNEKGLNVVLCSFGASIYDIEVANREGVYESVVMIPSDLNNFYHASSHYGKTVGRFAGRIANHHCVIDGVDYDLENNDNSNCLHAGKYGLAFVNFSYEIIEDKDNINVTFRHLEKENQLPGDVSYEITYKIFSKGNEFRIDYKANTTKDTLVNLTNHTYFNLSGNLKRDVLGETLKFYCDRYTKLNEHMICTSIEKVNKVMSFEMPHKIGNHINDASLTNHPAKGYDHCYIKKDFSKPEIAVLKDHKSKRKLTVYTDYPAVVTYANNYPDNYPFRPLNNIPKVHSGICFECQYVPNGINMENVNKAILKKGETYHHYIRYVFENI